MAENPHKKKIILFILSFFIFIILIAGGVGAYFYHILLSPNIFTPEREKTALNIPEGDIITDEMINLMIEKDIRIKDVNSLKKAIKVLQFNAVKPGHYVIQNGMSNKELVRLLQMGLQTPIQVTFNNIRTKEQLASVLSKQIMADSTEIISVLNDSIFLSAYNLTTDNVISVFIPNTYEFYWNTNGKELFERMYKEYKNFWNNERLSKAAAIPLSPVEVSILASIVEEETNKPYEYPVIAGLYINRLKKGMLLQADPTVKFAVGDFSLRRVLNSHLKTESPYNTYLNKGLPPGPIRVPSIQVIDAALNYEKHNYIFMAAKPNSSGEHNFASTLSEHNQNANIYRQSLNERRVY